MSKYGMSDRDKGRMSQKLNCIKFYDIDDLFHFQHLIDLFDDLIICRPMSIFRFNIFV